MNKIIHINPNCKDASRCLPHGETGEVRYRNMTLKQKIEDVKKELWGLAEKIDPEYKIFLDDSYYVLEELISSALTSLANEMAEKIVPEKEVEEPFYTDELNRQIRKRNDCIDEINSRINKFINN